MLGRVSRRNIAENTEKKENATSRVFRFLVDQGAAVTKFSTKFSTAFRAFSENHRKRTTSFVSEPLRDGFATVSKTFFLRIRSNATDQTPKFRSSLLFRKERWKFEKNARAFRPRRARDVRATTDASRRYPYAYAS